MKQNRKIEFRTTQGANRKRLRIVETIFGGGSVHTASKVYSYRVHPFSSYNPLLPEPPHHLHGHLVRDRKIRCFKDVSPTGISMLRYRVTSTFFVASEGRVFSVSFLHQIKLQCVGGPGLADVDMRAMFQQWEDQE